MSATTHPSQYRVEAETQESIVTRPGVRKVLAVARVVIGFTFLWAFLDKLFGLASPHRRPEPGSTAAHRPRDSSRESTARSTTSSRSSPTPSVTGCSWPACSASAWP